jgi:hypothetical protein
MTSKEAGFRDRVHAQRQARGASHQAVWKHPAESYFIMLIIGLAWAGAAYRWGLFG